MADTFVPKIKQITAPKAAEAGIKRGKKLLSEKRFDEALSQFEELVKHDQATPFVHTAIGRIKFKQRDLMTALRHFNLAIEMDPTQAGPYLRSARIHLSSGELTKAKDAFQNALRVNAKSAMAHAGLGLVHARSDHPGLAVEEWGKALTFNPRMVAVRKHLATTLHRMGRPNDAFAQINAALRIKSDDADVYAIKGRLHLLENEFAHSQQAYERAVELDPEGKKQAVRLGLAEAYIGGGKMDEAEEVLNAISQRKQSSAMVHKLWGDIYVAKGMHKEAAEEYSSAAAAADEDLEIEGFDGLDILADDGEDEKWEGLAVSARRAAGEAVIRKRHPGNAN